MKFWCQALFTLSKGGPNGSGFLSKRKGGYYAHLWYFIIFHINFQDSQQFSVYVKIVFLSV